MAGGVPAAPDLIRNGADLRTERAVQPVEHTRLAHAGVARERADLAADTRAQLVDARAGVCAHAQHLDAALPVGFIQLVTRIRVRLVDDDQCVYVLVHRDRRYFVDQERVGHRRCRARHGNDQIQIRHSRPDQAVLARRDRLQIAGIYKFIRNGGGLCELGFFINGGDATINPHFDICSKEITIVGSWVYTLRDYATTFDFLKSAKEIGLPMSELITHKFPLEEINEALKTNLAMSGLKIAIVNK